MKIITCRYRYPLHFGLETPFNVLNLVLCLNWFVSPPTDDTLFHREYQKKLDALNLDLEKARQEGFVPKHLNENGVTTKKKLLAVVGIITMFGRKNNRDAIRKAWMPTGMLFLHVEVHLVWHKSGCSGYLNMFIQWIVIHLLQHHYTVIETATKLKTNRMKERCTNARDIPHVVLKISFLQPETPILMFHHFHSF